MDMNENREPVSIFEFCKEHKFWACFNKTNGWWLFGSSRPGLKNGIWALANGDEASSWFCAKDAFQDKILYPQALCSYHHLITPNGLYSYKDKEYNRPEIKNGDMVIVWNGESGIPRKKIAVFNRWGKKEVRVLGGGAVNSAICCDAENNKTEKEWEHCVPYSIERFKTPVYRWEYDGYVY